MAIAEHGFGVLLIGLAICQLVLGRQVLESENLTKGFLTVTLPGGTVSATDKSLFTVINERHLAASSSSITLSSSTHHNSTGVHSSSFAASSSPFSSTILGATSSQLQSSTSHAARPGSSSVSTAAPTGHPKNNGGNTEAAPNFDTGMTAGTAVGCGVGAALILGLILWWKWPKLKRREAKDGVGVPTVTEKDHGLDLDHYRAATQGGAAGSSGVMLYHGQYGQGRLHDIQRS